MNKLSLLDQAFQTAFCTEPVKPGDTVTCECGISHKSTEAEPLRCGRGPGGYFLVSGCPCEYSGSFGGVLWMHRHEIANFFQGMLDAQARDRTKLMTEMPPEIGLGTK